MCMLLLGLCAYTLPEIEDGSFDQDLAQRRRIS